MLVLRNKKSKIFLCWIKFLTYFKIQRLKRHADRAFGDGKFDKAYELYNQLLQINPKDYEIIACLIGTALNLGYLDEVFSRSDYLIELDGKKAQVFNIHNIIYF